MKNNTMRYTIYIFLSVFLFTSFAFGNIIGPEAVVSGAYPHSTDAKEVWADRYNRLKPLAEAVKVVAATNEEAARLLATAYVESFFADYVGSDRCSDGPRGKDECDGGKARGFFQLHRSTCPVIWKMAPSKERLILEATCALSYLEKSSRMCANIKFGENFKSKTDPWGMNGYRGVCNAKDLSIRNKVAEVFYDVLLKGWPSYSSYGDFVRVSNPPYEIRKSAQKVIGEVRTLTHLGNGFYAFVEYHFDDKKWYHKGVSILHEAH